jgi:hypothetical protein
MPPSCGARGRQMAGSRDGAVLRSAHGLHPMWDDRRQRAACGAAGATEPDGDSVALMAKRPTPEMIAEGLTAPERIMLFLRRVDDELAEGWG